MKERIPNPFKKIIGLFELNTFKKKLVFSFFIVMLITSIFTVYVLVYAKDTARNYNSLYVSIDKLNATSYEINKAQEALEVYINETDKKVYMTECSTHIENSRKYSEVVLETLDQKDDGFKYIGLYNMICTYDELVDRCFYLFNGNDKGYFDEIYEARKVSKFIHNRVTELISVQLDKGAKKYLELEKRNNNMETLSLFLMFVVLLLVSVFIINISNNISKPVKLLSKGVHDVSEGNLDIDDINIHTKDEFFELSHSFNKMKKNMRYNINQLRDKVLIENKLLEEEMENLKMKNLLNEAELKVLQSQLNPHFLFNTLNTIARTAMLENAESTMDLIESTSELLRYNLGKVGSKVTLKDEIDNINEYIHIQQTRFQDRIGFSLDVEDEMLNLDVPFLFLQPLVENAIIHGIEPLENGGKVLISVKRDGDNAIIKVEDNGVGIPDEKLTGLLESDDEKNLGLKNVRKRLKYFFKADVMSIESKPMSGTAVIITIPVLPERRSENV
jgi:Putative regulator of cell autolysis